MTRVDEILDKLHGCKYFSKLDAKDGFLQIDLAKKDQIKTTFRTKQGCFCFVKMSFGLVNAPATYQRVMDNALKDFLWNFVVVYMDDCLVFSKSKEQHRKHLDQVKKRLEEREIILNNDKCEYFKKSLKFLGHIVSEKGYRPDPERVKAIRTAKPPETKKEMQSFLSFVSYCRKFINHLADNAAPLYDLISKNVKDNCFKKMFVGTVKESFIKVKNSISDDALLAFPNFESTFILTTDASKIGIGAILSQKENEVERPIEYFSRKHNSAQRNYCTTDQELLAVVEALKHFSPYLSGRPFTLRTDHKALIYLFKSKNQKSRLMRWSLEIQNFDINIEYLKGELNFTDFLSRNICDNNSISVITGTGNNENLNILKDIMMLGHGSNKSMRYYCEGRYNWLNINKQIKEIVKCCRVCSRAGGVTGVSGVTPIKIYEKNKRWKIDTIGPSNTSNCSYKFIITVIDCFTRKAAGYAVRTK